MRAPRAVGAHRLPVGVDGVGGAGFGTASWDLGQPASGTGSGVLGRDWRDAALITTKSNFKSYKHFLKFRIPLFEVCLKKNIAFQKLMNKIDNISSKTA